MQNFVPLMSTSQRSLTCFDVNEGYWTSPGSSVAMGIISTLTVSRSCMEPTYGRTDLVRPRVQPARGFQRQAGK